MTWLLGTLTLVGLLLLGGTYTQVRRGERRRAILMLIAAAVMLGNVALWVVPTEDGRSLVNAAPR
ncbi:MAG: hypothetical protein AABZ45_08195 [Pseudomonadota bacterium]